MPRSSLADIDCSIAQTLDVVTEWWTLLILRNAFHGMRTFDAFQEHLEISPSVLSARLKKLTDRGILEKRPSSTDGRSHEYRLTRRGLDLYPVLIALKDWGEKWVPNGRGRRMELIEKATGKPIRGAAVLSHDGRPLDPWDVQPTAGPGADDKIRGLMRKASG